MSESTIPTTFGLAAKNISAFAMALNEKTGEQIDSLAKIAAGVTKDELHIFGCDVERCPRCGGEALYCECPYDDRSIDEPCKKT